MRVDSGIVEGDEITTYYDPMIAKLIVWGKNREAALIQMQNALSQFHVDGLGNNIAFLEKLYAVSLLNKPSLIPTWFNVNKTSCLAQKRSNRNWW